MLVGLMDVKHFSKLLVIGADTKKLVRKKTLANKRQYYRDYFIDNTSC